MKTKAAVLVEINKPLEIQELEVPTLEFGQCLVRIVAAGICRTQLNEQAGLKGEDPYIPHLLGHEAAGWVEDVGPGVKKVHEGDYVVVSWIKGKGADVGGGKYINDRGGTVNSGGAAVYTQYAVVSENRLYPISEDIPSEVAALFGCAVPTGVGVIFNTLGLTMGQSVAIFGVGGVGGAAILGAKAAGCDPIIAIDIVDEKLELASKLGATSVISNVVADATDQIYEILPEGVDASIEATGSVSVGEQAFAALNRKGCLVIAGHPAHGSIMAIDPFRLIEGRSIIGSWGGDGDIDIDIPTYEKMYLDGMLRINDLVTQTYALEEVNDAFSVARSGEAGRVVLRITE